MQARLGEMLLRAGKINEAQLEHVLNVQSVYGGRLGTNLVEMGLVGEDELAHLLHEKLGVPSLEPGALDSMAQELLEAIPRDMVKRFRVLPVALEGKRLTVAMVDPFDYPAIEEIGFVTGYIVIPKVCTELRISMALERYYGISRAVRYLPSGGGARKGSSGVGPPPEVAVDPVEAAVEGENGKKSGIKVVADALASAAAEADVVSAVLRYLRREFDRGAFMGLKRSVGEAVQVIGVATRGGGFSTGAFPLREAELLQWVVQERRLFIGELSADGGDGLIRKAVGCGECEPALLLPLSVAGQVVAILCVTDLQGRLAAGIFDLQRVAAMAELALEMLCIRKRIKSG